jgi:hypothetical protein
MPSRPAEKESDPRPWEESQLSTVALPPFAGTITMARLPATASMRERARRTFMSESLRWAAEIPRGKSLLPSATITQSPLCPTRLAAWSDERPMLAETEHGRSAAPNPTATLSPTTWQDAAAGDATNRTRAAAAPATEIGRRAAARLPWPARSALRQRDRSGSGRTAVFMP